MTARILGIDNVRVVLTIAVIGVHAAITYSDEGSWFYREGGTLPEAARLAIGLPIAVGELFGMGLFFFLAGVFLPDSLRRKGLRRFVSGRVVRLGLPLLVFVLLLVPVVELAVARVTGQPASAWSLWRNQFHDLDAGPLWFVWVLLLFSVAAATLLWQRPEPGQQQALGWRAVLAYMVLVAAGSFLLRLAFAVDSYQPGAAHLWQWGQCLGLFALGVHAGRQGWLTNLPRSVVRACGWAFAGGALALVVLVAIAGDDLDPLGGGWHWQSLAVAAIEGVVSVSASLFVIDLLTRRPPARWLNPLSRNAYGAYLLQTPVLVGIALAMRQWEAPPAVKLAVLLVSAVLASFGIAALLVRLPGVRLVL